MTDKEKLLEAIRDIKPAYGMPFCVIAFSDEEEQIYKKYYPGIEILRAFNEVNVSNFDFDDDIPQCCIDHNKWYSNRDALRDWR